MLTETNLRRRWLARDPVVFGFAVLPLVLGSAALVAIFSLVYGLLGKPFPWRDAESLVYVWEEDPVQPDRATSMAAFADWRRQTRSFSDLSALQPLSFTLTAQPRPEAPFSRRVTASYFDVFGVEPILGRVFDAEEEQRGAKVVLLSRALWQRQFDADPSIVGRSVELDHEPYEVLGVIELESPREPAPVELWVPLTLAPTGLDRRARPIAVWGHLAEGVTPEAAASELATIMAAIPPAPGDPTGRRPRVQRVADDLVGELRMTLLRLAGVGLVMLGFLAAHTAHLVVARAPVAAPASAIRGALTVAALGGLAGIALSPLALSLVKAAIPKRFGVPPLDHLTLDGLVAVGVLAGVLLVAAVAARLLHRAPTAAGGRSRAAVVLVAAQVVLALALAGGAVVATRDHLQRGRAGFHEPEQVLTLRVGMRGASYDAAPARIALLASLLERLARLEGASGVAATDVIPLGIPNRGMPVKLDAGPSVPSVAGDTGEIAVLPQVVTPDFFSVLGIPLIEGRVFSVSDTAATAPVAIVNHRFVRDHFGGRSPLGRTLTAGNEPSREIIGVVGDSRAHEEPWAAVPTVYLPHTQRPARTMTFFIRTAAAPQTLGEAASAAVSELDRFLPVYGVRSLGEVLREADWRSRLTMSLLLFFAVAAAILAIGGSMAIARSRASAGAAIDQQP